MAYNPSKLEEKLNNIVETQEGIQSVSQWVMFHKRHAATSAETWAKIARSAPEPKKLGLVYVANEVVQQAKIKNKDAFVEEFAKQLPDALADMCSQVNPQIQDRIKRVAQVWKDRKIFPAVVLGEIDASLGNSGSNGGSARAAVPPMLQELAAATGQLKTFRPPTIPADSAAAKPIIESAQKQVAAQIEAVQRALAAIDTLQVDLTSRRESLEANARALEDKALGLGDDDEDPSPEIEADSEPEVYTASAAAAEDDDCDELAEVDEAPAKKPKLDLDPKLASFLASMQS